MPQTRQLGSLCAMALLLVGCAGPEPQTPVGASDPVPAAVTYDEIRNDVKASIDVGLGALRWEMAEDGSWSGDPGVTGLVLRAFMESHRHYIEDDGPFIRNPVAYLAASSAQNGAIGRSRPAFQTAAATVPLAATSNASYHAQVDAAGRYLVSVLDDDPAPDRYDLAFIIPALRAAGLPEDSPAWSRVTALIDADADDSSRDGTASAALALYGLLQAGLDRDDPRVQTAWATFTATDPLDHLLEGDHGLYHRHFAVASALHAYGASAFEDQTGRVRDWKAEIAGHLIERQGFDGFWVNDHPFRSEDDRFVASSLALLALETIYNQ